MPERKRVWPSVKRDSIIFAVGLGLVVNEYVIRPEPRAFGFALILACFGLAPVWHANDIAKRILGSGDEEKKT